MSAASLWAGRRSPSDSSRRLKTGFRRRRSRVAAFGCQFRECDFGCWLGSDLPQCPHSGKTVPFALPDASAVPLMAV